MTDIEKIEYAKSFIDKLANGINPLDNSNVPEGDIVNNVRLSRCFFFVSDVLRQVIENGGVVSSKITAKVKKQSFILTQEQREKIVTNDNPMTISEITDYLNSLIDLEATKKISSTTITNWLIEKGFLINVTVNGKNRKKPTEYGNEIGISTIEKHGMYGLYTVIIYNASAQQFIYDNIDDILALKNMDKWYEKNNYYYIALGYSIVMFMPGKFNKSWIFGERGRIYWR